MPFIPSQAKIILGGSGGSSANTATNAETASMLYNSQSVYGILQISNSNNTNGWDVSASQRYSVLALTSSVSASLISHAATNITYSATNVLHTSSNTYEIKARNLNFYAEIGGGIKFFNNNIAISNSVLYTDASGFLKGIAGTQTGQIPIYNSGWTTALTSSLSVKNATTATTIAGILPVASGGTGRNTLTSGAILIGNGTADVDFLPLPASGSMVVTNATGWTTRATSSLPLQSTTASYIEPQWGTGDIYIGFNQAQSAVQIYNATANGAVTLESARSIELKAASSVNIESVQLNLNVDRILFSGAICLDQTSDISISGTPTTVNLSTHNKPVVLISSSTAGKTASFSSPEQGTAFYVTNVGSQPILITTNAGTQLFSNFSLGINSSSQLGFSNSRFFKYF
jgi:hypothetical protein